MKLLLAAFLLSVLAGSATAFQPRSGVWANLNESGSGYTIEIQEGVLVITIYSYQPGGAPQWYLASGPMTNDQHNFAGTLDKYVGGQCITCAYAGRPSLVGNDGTISIVFASETSATLTLAGSRTTAIQPFNFGIGDPPTGLLGEWVFFYDVGTTTVANRFDFASVQPPSSADGNGIAVDLARAAACELQISGEAAGMVVCAVINASGSALLYGYVFRFGLDQTYDGLWISGDGMNFHPMKGFKVASRSGSVNRKASSARGASIMESSTPDVTASVTIQAAIDAIRHALPMP